MEKLKYDTDDFSFKELLWDWFKVDLDRLHENSKYKYFRVLRLGVIKLIGFISIVDSNFLSKPLLYKTS